MDMEWAVDHQDRIWILQARPETVWSKRNKEKKAGTEMKMTTDHKVLVKGLPASREWLPANATSSLIRKTSTNSRKAKSS